MQEEKISLVLSTVFASVSLVDFKTILDIILLIASIINIIIIIVIKLVRYLKDKKLSDEELQDLQNDFNKLNDKIGR